MFAEEANQIVVTAEKRGRSLGLDAVSSASVSPRGPKAPGGVRFEEAFQMLRQKTCPQCQTPRTLQFHVATYDHLCPRCGHNEKPSDARFMTQTLSQSKADTIIPIVVAILMTLVFALTVFWVAFGHSAR